MTFGEKLKKLRIENNLSQEDLAEKLGVSRQAVSKWEQDLALPDTNNLISIAKIFGVSIDYLVNYNEDTKEETKKESDESKEQNNKFSESIEDFEERIERKANKQEWDKKDEIFEKSPIFIVFASVIPIVCILLFILLGVFLENGWRYSWLAILLIPVLISLVEAIFKKKLTYFAYPVLIVFVYLLIGMLTGLWHPYWFLFITIPLYYVIAEPIDRFILGKKEEEEEED